MNDLFIHILEPLEGRWCLVLGSTDDASYELLQELHLQSSGYTWEAIAHALVALRAPHLAELLDINAAGDEMYTFAATRAPLEELETLLRAAAADHDLLRAAMDRWCK